MALKNCFGHSSSQRTCFRSRSSLVVIAADGGILPENVKNLSYPDTSLKKSCLSLDELTPVPDCLQ